MAVYAAFLSGGSQIGPAIAGYLIEARGWRWFFILCAIVAALDLVAIVLMVPETIHGPSEQPQGPCEEPGKDTPSHLETVPTRSQARPSANIDNTEAKMDYGEYFKGLFDFSLTHSAQQMGVIRFFTYCFILPFPLLLIPGVFIASIMYGVTLGG